MRNLAIACAFLLGACTTAAVTSRAAAPPTGSPPAESAKAGWVRSMSDAPQRISPNGLGRIWLLAHGKAAFVGRLQLASGAEIPEHQDATEETIVVLEGGGTITIDGVEHEVTAGSTIFMPANARVRYKNGPAPMVAIQVFAGPEPAAKYEAWTEAGEP